MGLAATGSHASNGSGEQMIAFSTANRFAGDGAVREVRAVVDGPLPDGSILSSIFRATVDATEEAVVNALVAAEDLAGREGRAYSAMPIERVLEMLDRAGRLRA
jgi:D-aminopeptidase